MSDSVSRASASVWSQPLEEFQRDLAAPTPAPAAVTAAAVTARLGLALLIKTLTVVVRRKSFSGDAAKLNAIIEAAEDESVRLRDAADEDIVASPDRRRSDVPMKAARAAETGFALCEQARAFASGAVSADLEAAAVLLASAARVIHLCVRANILPQPDQSHGQSV